MAWTGEKRRRKTVIGGAPSSPALGLGSSSSDDADATEAMLMDTQVQEEEELVFSAESVLNFDELSRCYQVLRSREHHIYPSISPRLDKDGVRKVAERFYQFRYRDFKSLDEYDQWEKYCLAFSNYETDEEYVKYWGELFKKIKWIEDYIHLEFLVLHGKKEFAMYRTNGASQAMKIAEGFCHLPASLATLGYHEYINALDDSFDLLRKDYDRVYLGLWKRVTKQGVLKSREHHIYPSIAAQLDADGRRKVGERFYQLRYRDFKLLKEGNLDETSTDTVPMSEYPDEVLQWESGMFGWTFDHTTFYFADLDDYQRMVPKTASLDLFHQWEKYHLAFSNYETDEEYVKYWVELFKKIKWIEEYRHLDYKEFSTYKSRGASQAMKIAEGFCHLPASLATLGYNEYIDALEDRFDLLREDNGRLYLELWKRVTKQGMSFEDALQDILASDNKLPPPCLHRIKLTIMGYEYDILEHFLICEKHIGKHIVDDDDDATVLKHITDALYTKIRRRKWYVDYAKTKLEVARRIRMLPASGSQP